MRVLLSTFGTAGDIIPFARLADALMRRDHAVTVHSWEQYRSWFPVSATFVDTGASVSPDAFAAGFTDALRAQSFVDQVLHFARVFYGLGDGASRARAYYERACTAFAGHDLAVINALDHVGQAAATDIGLRWLSYTSRPPPDPAAGDPFFAEVDAALGALLGEVTGRPRRVRVFREQSSIRTLVPCSPQIVDAEPNVVVTGAWLDPIAPVPAPLSPEIEAFLAGGPTILMTFGTMPDVNDRTRTLIDAARASEARTIIQVLAPCTLGTIPDTVLVVRDRISFATLLPRVDAVVHHGSIGTLHEILRAGRPSLVLPHMGDQFFYGGILHAKGVSPAPVRVGDISAGRLAFGLIALRQTKLAAKAAELAPLISAEDGLAVAVRELEACA